VLGVFTFVRLVECGAEDFRYGLAINRIRGYYKQLAGDEAILFLLSGHDDGRGVFANASVPPEGRSQFFAFGSVVAVINSVVGGSAVAIALGASSTRRWEWRLAPEGWWRSSRSPPCSALPSECWTLAPAGSSLCSPRRQPMARRAAGVSSRPRAAPARHPQRIVDRPCAPTVALGMDDRHQRGAVARWLLFRLRLACPRRRTRSRPLSQRPSAPNPRSAADLLSASGDETKARGAGRRPNPAK
jgi:hypothetical protein